ncbi:MAG: hypothetical protein IPN95_16455 [Bacteroidetes bacterium]|nr:hypothetical protein [Bacteroidota bacterium]
MTQADVLALADSNLDKFLKESGFPEKYKAAGIKNDIKAGKYTVKDVAEYFGDANAVCSTPQPKAQSSLPLQ